MVRSFLLACGLMLAAPTVFPAWMPVSGTTADAAELKFKARSTYPYRMHLEFYGQIFNSVWPGNGEVDVLKDSKYHTDNLWCGRGDKVCYGA